MIGWLFSTVYAADIEPTLSTGGELEADEGPFGPSPQGVAADAEGIGSFPGG